MTALLRTTDLGPNQIEWLRTHVPSFAKAKDQADAALAHAAESRMPKADVAGRIQSPETLSSPEVTTHG